MIPDFFVSIDDPKLSDEHQKFIKEIKKEIFKLRNNSEWVPKKYINKINRRKKLKKIYDISR